MLVDFLTQSPLEGIDFSSAAILIFQGVITFILLQQQFRTGALIHNVENIKSKTAEIDQKTGIINNDTSEIIKKTESIKTETADLSKNTESINNEIVQVRKISSSIDKDISDTNFETSKINKSIAQLNLDYLKEEIKFKTDSLRTIEQNSGEISDKIAKELTRNPTWLDRFMDETGATYVGSIFGKRINHFHYEKKVLAKKAIDVLEKELKTNKVKKYCLLIDSGTTMYHLFSEMCERVKKANVEKNEEELDIWTKRVFVVTNNLPGIQYFMKHCRVGSNEYADILIKCLLLPGKPLSVYGAVTGSETTHFLRKEKEEQEEYIRPIIREALGAKEGEYEIISFITGNYMARHFYENTDLKDSYCPVARGEGHVNLKIEFVKLSDKIYLISPLTKFSFATCEELNYYNKFTINELNDKVNATEFPSKVMYREIEILTEKKYKEKCTFFVTTREGNDIFKNFADEIISELQKSYNVKDTPEKVIVATEFKLQNWIPFDKQSDAYRDLELKKEIPHEYLREMYTQVKKDGHFIWDVTWIGKSENEKPKIE